MEKKCPVCGLTYDIKPSHAHKRATCSRKCMAELYKEKQRGENNPHWKGGKIGKVCPACSRRFEVSLAYTNTRQYCSRKCKDTAQRKTRQLRLKMDNQLFRHNCKLCGLPIPGNRRYCQVCSPRGKQTVTSYCEVCSKSFTHWVKRPRRFCSMNCYKKNSNGAGNTNWKGGKLTLSQIIRQCDKNRRLVASVLKRDKYTCQKCGQVGGDLEVDHIKPFADIMEEFIQHFAALDLRTFAYELSLVALKYKPFWDKGNLRTLCRKCNWQRQVERNQRPADFDKIVEILSHL